MKAPSIILFAGILTLCTARPTPAVMTEYSTTNRAVAVTNVLPTSEVRPLAAYVIFPAPSTGTVSISRVTRGVAVPLARHSFTNASALTWLPPADFPIRRWEAFAVSSTVARFTLQLETSNGSEEIHRTDAPEWYDEGRPFSFVASSGGGSTQVIVTNSQSVMVTNNIVVTNSVTVNTGGGGGPQFDVGPAGEYVATNNTVLGVQGDDFILSALGNNGTAGRNLILQSGDSFGSGAVGGNVIARLGNGDTGAGTWDFRITDSGNTAIAVIRNDAVVQLLGAAARLSLNDQAAVYLDAGDLYLRGKDNAPEEGNDVFILGGGGGGGGGDGGTIIVRPGLSPVGNAGAIQLQDASGNNIFEVSGIGTISAGGTEAVTETIDVLVPDGTGGFATNTLHFVKGIYTGHTIP